MAALQSSSLDECSEFFKCVLPMELHHLKKIEEHIASGNCSHSPHLKDFIFDQNQSVPGTTPLLLACQQGEIDSVKHIVESWGVDVRTSATFYLDLSRPHGLIIKEATPLFVAAFCGYDKIVRYLLQKGAEVSAKTSNADDNSLFNGWTPLYGAVFTRNWNSRVSLLQQLEDRSNIVRSLLKFGADVATESFCPSDGKPMWEQDMCGVGSIITLIKHGLDLKMRGNGRCLLHYVAAQSARPNALPSNLTEEDALYIAKVLVDLGADLMSQDDDGFTPLLTAATSFNSLVLEYLLERNEYSLTEKIEAMELAGATILFEAENDSHSPKAFEHWRRAHQLRQMEIEVFGPSSEKILGRKIGNNVEWTTLAELDQLEKHPEHYKIQALLVKLRILSGFIGNDYRYWSWKYIDWLTERDVEYDNINEILDIRWGMLDVEILRLDRLSTDSFEQQHAFHILLDNVKKLVAALSTLQENCPALLNFERINTSLHLILQATDSSPITVLNGEDTTDNWFQKRLQFTQSLLALLEMIFQLPQILNANQISILTQTLRLLGPGRLGSLILFQTRKGLGNFKDLAVVRVLLEAGADPNVAFHDFHENASLHIVAGMSDRKLGDAAGLLLVEFGSNLHKVNHAGKTALDIWIELNETEDNQNKETGGWNARPEWCCPLPTLLRLAARVVRLHKINYANGKTPTDLHSLIELRSNADY